MKITNLGRAALQNLRQPIEAELAALGERLGISLKLGNGKFGDGAEATFQLEDTKTAAAKANWDRNCTYIGIDFAKPDETGLRPEDFGTEFAYGGATYRTAGIALKGRGSQKFPILCVIAKAGPGGGKAGDVRMLPETAVPRIRAATDAAKAKAAA
jgi:hypothetical protein